MDIAVKMGDATDPFVFSWNNVGLRLGSSVKRREDIIVNKYYNRDKSLTTPAFLSDKYTSCAAERMAYPFATPPTIFRPSICPDNICIHLRSDLDIRLRKISKIRREERTISIMTN